jgi:hypothetical protein
MTEVLLAVMASIAKGITMANHPSAAAIGSAPLYLPFRVDR